MRHTLLLRLIGPMQSWGLSSRFSERDTGLEPSKSGVVGLIAAALGRDRTEPVDDLAALRMGVRVDKEGVLTYDFHTAGAGPGQRGIIRANGSGFNTSISRRYFLQDAAFLVGLEGGDIAFLRSLDAALRAPVHPIGLGRRSQVPSVPVAMPGSPGAGVRVETPLSVALAEEPWPITWLPEWQRRRVDEGATRVILEASHGALVRRDQPAGAAYATRRFEPRAVRIVPLAGIREEHARGHLG